MTEYYDYKDSKTFYYDCSSPRFGRSSMCFLRWLVLFLCTIGGFYYAWKTGIPQTVWKTDVSNLTKVIGSLFIVSTIWVGISSWLVDSLDDDVASRNYFIMNFFVPVFVMLGLVGTAVGMSTQLQVLAGIDPSNSSAITKTVSEIGRSFGTSVWCTITGLVTSLVFSFQALNYRLCLWARLGSEE